MRQRHDGFTATKRRKFLKALGKMGCIRDAAKVAAISTTSVDRWRAKDKSFDRQCIAALDMAASRIEPLAWERAVTGIEEPVIHYGKVVGTRIKRSDAIFRMLLMASNPKKYGRMGAVKQKAIEREVRARVEAEVRAEVRPRLASDEEVEQALVKRLAAFSQRVRAKAAQEQPDGPPQPDEGRAGPGATPE